MYLKSTWVALCCVCFGYIIIDFIHIFNIIIEAETNGPQFPDDILKCIFLNENI